MDRNLNYRPLTWLPQTWVFMFYFHRGWLNFINLIFQERLMSSYVLKEVCLQPLYLSVNLGGHNIPVHIFILSMIRLHCFLTLDAPRKSEASLSLCFLLFLPLHNSLCSKINNVTRIYLCPLLCISFPRSTQCPPLIQKSFFPHTTEIFSCGISAYFSDLFVGPFTQIIIILMLSCFCFSLSPYLSSFL